MTKPIPVVQAEIVLRDYTRTATAGPDPRIESVVHKVVPVNTLSPRRHVLSAAEGMRLRELKHQKDLTEAEKTELAGLRLLVRERRAASLQRVK